MRRIIERTQSLCPDCLKKVNAMIWTKNNQTWMEKSCPEHGRFRALLWQGSMPLEEWVRNKCRAAIEKPNTQVERGCPFDCGLCPEHRQHTCTALIEVTNRCNLSCRFCFADAHARVESDLSLQTIEGMYKSVMETSGPCNIQLSGGEPTIRDDLPKIIRMGHEIGFSFIQVNTNGIRMGEDEGYVEALKEAGLSSVFLQFDGTEELVFKKLRGKSLLTTKIKALENLKKYNLSVVLVPTLVPGVNDHDIGNMIAFAKTWIPTVKGIHFQPASYFGRIPNLPDEETRLTLGDLMDKIEKQTGGEIRKKSFGPPGCENARCSFHGNFIFQKNGKLMPTQGQSKCCGETAEEGARKTKAHMARNWGANRERSEAKQEKEIKDSWDEILYRIRNYSFSVSAMAFQDVWNLDLNRVRDCCIHVVNSQGKLIPFCMYNLTSRKGKALYRSES